MKPQALVVDDEPIARQILEQYLKDDGRISLAGTCKNALEANQWLQQNKADVLFLDINMPKLSGLEFLKTLPHPPKVIFTTAYREYAVEGFELAAVDYLVKPFSLPRFMQAVSRIMETSTTEAAAFFFIKVDGRTVKIQYDDILYVESLSEYIRIHTTDKTFTLLTSLRSWSEKLPADRFLQIHRSYLVAIDKIEAVEGNQVLIQAKQIPVSRSYKPQLMERMKGYYL